MDVDDVAWMSVLSDVVGAAEVGDPGAGLAQLFIGNGQHDPDVVGIIKALQQSNQ